MQHSLGIFVVTVPKLYMWGVEHGVFQHVSFYGEVTS